jgi:biotin carboxylase
MAHFLVVEVPGGGYGLIEQILSDGHTFSFVTQNLDTYLRMRNFRELPLSRAFDIAVINPYNYEIFLEKILKIHGECPIDAILCSIDFRILDVSKIAAHLGVKFLNIHTSEIVANKFKVRTILKDKGILQPDFHLAHDRTSLIEAIEKIGYPIVVKPVDGFASIRTNYIKSHEDLDVVQEDFDRPIELALGQKSSGLRIVEKWINGPIFSCEVISHKSNHHILGLTDRLASDEWSPVERGGCFPATTVDHCEIYSAAQKILDSLGFDYGPSHIEFIVGKDGPYLLEINPRLIGGVLPNLLTLALGRPIYRDILNLYLKDDWYIAPSEYRGIACIRWICAPKRGQLKNIEIPPPFNKNIWSFGYNLRPGTCVRPAQDNGDRIAYVMTLAETQEKAESQAQEVLSVVRIDIDETLI